MATQLEANPIRLPGGDRFAAGRASAAGPRLRGAGRDGRGDRVAGGGVLDWAWTRLVVEPDWPMRVAGLGIVALGLIAIVYHLILRRAARPLSDANMAVLLERRFGQFGDRLLTTVELTDAAAAARRLQCRFVVAHGGAGDRRQRGRAACRSIQPPPAGVACDRGAGRARHRWLLSAMLFRKRWRPGSTA